MESIILASGSLRRQDYFKLLGLPFKTVPPLIQEVNHNNLPALEFAIEMAKKKILKVIGDMTGKPPRWIFAADTVIEYEDKIFGKPASREDAEQMLRAFSGKVHSVVTACALYNGRLNEIDCQPVCTKVKFACLEEQDINWYLDTGEWQGAAGSYKIQGLGSCLVASISGSYSNVVGLPMRVFYEMLIKHGYPYHSAA